MDTVQLIKVYSINVSVFQNHVWVIPETETVCRKLQVFVSLPRITTHEVHWSHGLKSLEQLPLSFDHLHYLHLQNQEETITK